MKYHFIGIKGSGMASLATILNDLGYGVQGSDIEKHFFTEIGLRERNIKILCSLKNLTSSNQAVFDRDTKLRKKVSSCLSEATQSPGHSARVPDEAVT